MTNGYPSQAPPLNSPYPKPPRGPPPRRFPTQNPTQQPHSFMTEEESSNSTLWLIIGIFIAVIVIVFALIFFLGSSNNISESDLSQGTSLVVGEDEEIKFSLDETEHTITVNSVSTNSASITIQSDPITATFNRNEIKKFDLNDDNTLDLRVKLVTIEDDKANFFIKKISELDCSEDWNCTVWSSCTNYTQTRNCLDLNTCGTNVNKPTLQQNCNDSNNSNNNTLPPTNLTCIEKTGELCFTGEYCNGTIMSSVESDICCYGDCAINSSFLPSCSTQNGSICNSTSYCGAEELAASEDDVCCEEICITNVTLVTSCSYLNGTACNPIQSCSGNFLNASDEMYCCDATCVNPLPSCSSLGGFLCAGNQTCSGIELNASESEVCCDADCNDLPIT